MLKQDIIISINGVIKIKCVAVQCSGPGNHNGHRLAFECLRWNSERISFYRSLDGHIDEVSEIAYFYATILRLGNVNRIIFYIAVFVCINHSVAANNFSNVRVWTIVIVAAAGQSDEGKHQDSNIVSENVVC